MSKENYFEKVNVEVLTYLRDAAVELQKKGAFFQASMIYHALTESMIRAYIASYLMREKEMEEKVAERYYDEPQNLRFATLINYFELLSNDAEKAKKLRDYNKQRNELVHNILHFNTMEELRSCAKDNATEGKTIYYLLADEVRELNTVRIIHSIKKIEK